MDTQETRGTKDTQETHAIKGGTANGLEPYREEIDSIFTEALREIMELPAELRAVGRTLLSRSHPLQNGGGTNAVCYLLPYWLREETGVPIALCRDMAIGNLYAMLHYFVLDDAMDAGTERVPSGLRRSLALGQLLSGMFRQRYASHFPDDASLWAYERKYAEQWASAVCREAGEPVHPHDCGQLAGKAAPVKLCAAGQLIWAGRPERIPEMEQAVDLALAVLQLSDDRADWREDLAEPNRNAMLTLVRDELALSAGDPLDERSVKRAIFRRGCLDQLAEIASGYLERMQALPNVPPGLAGFQRAIVQSLHTDAHQVRETLHKFATNGALSQILMKFDKS